VSKGFLRTILHIEPWGGFDPDNLEALMDEPEISVLARIANDKSAQEH